MQYPCIVYSKNTEKTVFAGNVPYMHRTGYMVTVIDRDPDSEIPEKIAMLPMCIFDRHYTTGGFNHDVYNLYY
jgi:CO dehydrogenase nickel-insertion accessory protein CooC1